MGTCERVGKEADVLAGGAGGATVTDGVHGPRASEVNRGEGAEAALSLTRNTCGRTRLSTATGRQTADSEVTDGTK